MIRIDRTRCHFLHGIVAVITALALQQCIAESSTPRKLNFVLIIGDDISEDDFGCYGHPNIRTPNVDELAANGIRFSNAYLTTSQCSPTRCSVISGRYPHNTGAPELHQPLPEGQLMFPLELKKAGYVGLVVEELKRQEALDNTVIIFMADNGRQQTKRHDYSRPRTTMTNKTDAGDGYPLQMTRRTHQPVRSEHVARGVVRKASPVCHSFRPGLLERCPVVSVCDAGDSIWRQDSAPRGQLVRWIS